jgi:hypothetical protein
MSSPFVPPAIPASNPTIVPATAQVVYDKWYLSRLLVQAFDPTKPIRATATLQKSAVLSDGSVQLSPVDKPVIVTIPDLIAAAQADPDLATVWTSLIAAVVQYAKQQVPNF